MTKTKTAAQQSDDDDFLTRADRFIAQAAGQQGAPLTEERIRVLADAEALGATANSEGVIAIGDDGLTPGMRQARSTLMADYERWKTLADQWRANLAQRTSQITGRLHDLEHKIPQERAAQLEAAIAAQRALLARNATYTKVNRQLPNLKNHYEQLRDGPNLGVEPEDRPKWLYWLILLLFFIVDMIANFEVFERKFPPALATLATVLVAAVIAWPAHVHGRYFKQFIMLFDVQISRIKRILSHANFVLAIALLLVGLAALFWARYSFLLDTSPNPTPDELFRAVSPTLGINFGLWFMSAVYSWWWHESV